MKIQDAVLNFVACMQKFKILYEGPLVQIFPETIPARDYISHGAAQALGLPYSIREAWKRYRILVGDCNKEWEKENGNHEEQMKLCVSILELGMYNLMN